MMEESGRLGQSIKVSMNSIKAFLSYDCENNVGQLRSGIQLACAKSYALENQAIITSGKALTVANGSHIVTQQFLDNMIGMTGSGVTIGLVLRMVLIGKSAQSKELGKLAMVPGCFNINEPVTFGTPIVINTNKYQCINRRLYAI